MLRITVLSSGGEKVLEAGISATGKGRDIIIIVQNAAGQAVQALVTKSGAILTWDHDIGALNLVDGDVLTAVFGIRAEVQQHLFLLDLEDFEERQHACASLGSILSSMPQEDSYNLIAITRALARVLQDGHWQVREAAARALRNGVVASVGREALEVLNSLIAVGSGPDEENRINYHNGVFTSVSEEAWYTIAVIAGSVSSSGEAFFPILSASESALHDEDPYISALAIQALGRLGKAVSESDREDKAEIFAGILSRVCMAIEDTREPEYIAEALPLASGFVVQLTAANVLGEMGDASDRAVNVLVEMLHAPELQDCVTAIQALGKVGAVRAVDALIDIINARQDDEIQVAAAEALDNLNKT